VGQRFTAFAVLLVASLTAAASEPLPWDGPLIPVESGYAILATHCPEGSRLAWNSNLRRAAHGMVPGELVWILTPDGVFPGSLGVQQCFGGECHAAYAALPVLGKKANRARAVVPRRFLTASHRAAPMRKVAVRKGHCSRSPRLQWLAGTCTSWSAGIEGVELDIQTETRREETGWDSIRQHLRVRAPGQEGKWKVISETVDELEPVVMVAEPHEGREPTYRILWYRAVGISGPAELSVVFTEVKKDGGLTWGRYYHAGGQPCD
jgi:hypothetical protein